MSLTPKQEKFCQEYIKTSNASEAYRQAYNTSKMKDKTIWERASVLLADSKVATRVSELAKTIEEEFTIEIADLLRETARIAYFDPRKLINPNGTTKLLHELDSDTAAAIKSFEIDEYGRIKYQFWDKNSGQERLFKHKGLYEKDNKQKTDPLLEFLGTLPGAVLGPKKSDG